MQEPTAANNQEEALRSSGYTGILLATEPVPVPAPVAVAVPVQAPALAPSEQAERDLDEVVHSAVLTSAAEAVPLPAPAPAPAPSDQPICESDIDELVHSVTLTSDGEAVASVKSDLAAAESRAQRESILEWKNGWFAFSGSDESPKNGVRCRKELFLIWF